MAFLLSYSSSIGKRLLLFSLSRLDILDKDPSDFVEVSVGKKSTLELRDVGLRVERLTSLLHLELPPELRLTTARVALLRLTLTLELQNPGILIEVDGVKLLARLDSGGGSEKEHGKKQTSPSPTRRDATGIHSHGQRSDQGEEIPSAENLAKSFLQEEPLRERQQLEEAFHSQSRSLSESTSSSEDEDDPMVGMGAAPTLPGFLERFIRGALDRCEVIIRDINVRLDAEIPPEEKKNNENEKETTEISLNFRIAQAAIDGLSSANPEIVLEPQSENKASPAAKGRSGQRKILIRNIGAELVSSPEMFLNLSRSPPPSSPRDTRSTTSSQEQPLSESISSVSSVPSPVVSEIPVSRHSPEAPVPQQSLEEALANAQKESFTVPRLPPTLSPTSSDLETSILTTDDDRFADAASDDGHGDHEGHDDHDVSSSTHSDAYAPRLPVSQIPFSDQEGESILQDQSFLAYAMDKGMWDSTIDDDGNHLGSSLLERHFEHQSEEDRVEPLRIATALVVDPVSSAQMSDGPPPTRRGPFYGIEEEGDNEDEDEVPETAPVTDNYQRALAVAKKSDLAQSSVSNSSKGSPPREDLSESRLYDHEDAESMYMSAYSRAPTSYPGVPGGWDSTSSEDETPNTKYIRPPEETPTTTSSHIEPEDCSVTPRPGSRAGHIDSPHASPSEPSFEESGTRGDVSSDSNLSSDEKKVAKPILRIDEASVWFPWPSGGQTIQEPSSPKMDDSSQHFTPFGEDTFHQDMPGAFSLYAESGPGHRRRLSSTDLSRSKLRHIQKTDTSPTDDGSIPNPNESFRLDLEVGSIQMQIDLITGRLILRVLQNMQTVFSKIVKSSKGEPAQTDTKESSDHKSSSIQILSLRELSLSWIENITTVQVDYPLTRPMDSELDSSETILKLNIGGAKADRTESTTSTKMKMTLDHFSFGLANSDIVSFDNAARMRTSIRDLKEPLISDVLIEYVTGPARSELNIATLPALVNFDVTKIDEAFTSFGGFSGMLELGNSITSNSTLSPRQLSVPPPPRTRGVHFERVPPVTTQPPGLPIKLNARFGGAVLILKGKSCAVQVRTSAVKMVGRSAGVRIQIDKMKLSGPHAKAIDEDSAPLLAACEGTRIDFLFGPEETDLTRLLSLLTPSKDKYEDDDDILVDALLRQRQKGSVLRLTMDSVRVDTKNLGEIQMLTSLGEELSKLSTVTKYLPEDDRPGILTLGHIKEFQASVEIDNQIGIIYLDFQGARVAHVGWPSLFALEMANLSARRGESETLIHKALQLETVEELPMLMARKVGDEIEPTLKVKLYNLCIEYRVTTIMALLKLNDDATSEDIATGLADSVATITGPTSPRTITRQSSTTSVNSGMGSKPMRVELQLRDCALGLNPRGSSSKALILLTNTRFMSNIPKDSQVSAKLELRKASLLLIDDIARFDEHLETDPSYTSLGSRQVIDLCHRGFVSISTISSAVAAVNISGANSSTGQEIGIDFKNDLLLLETCADSTQTLFTLLGGLAPPMPPSKEVQYRTQVVPMDEMMASFTGDAYTTVPDNSNDPGASFMDDADTIEDDLPTNLEYVGSFYNPESLPTEEELGDELLEGDLLDLRRETTSRKIGQSTLLESFQERYEVDVTPDELEIQDNYFGAESEIQGTAHKWNSEKKQYGWENEFKTSSPLKVRVRDVHMIWHLFDGYDWAKTRDTIAQAVEDVENRAEERRQRPAAEDTEELQVEEDFLFNSVWISLPLNEERGTLARKINHEIDDLVSETGSYATSTASRSTARPRSSRTKRKGLRLNRSRHHKISFELSGVSADIIVFPPGTGETQSSVDIRVTDFEIFDNVPTSTWKKFLTYMKDAGEREMGRPQIHIELLNVRPVPTLAASELVMRVSILPIRLHVDQDALDFITRFFEFKDESVVSTEKGEQPFIQRLEVNTVRMKLDYKPKRVDYRSLRSGRTTEFKNFFILDSADITLRHCILYGISGFDKLNDMLNDIWMPDVKRNQLPGVLAGLAPVRSIVNVGGGVRDLVVIPMREYKKDGRIVRSIQKGAVAFAKTTTTELARLGAKVAIGTQNVLQNAEGLLSPATHSASPSRNEDWEDISGSPPPRSDSPPRAHSNYADQPMGVMAGLRSAARSLERDLLTAKDAIIAIPAEVMESDSPGGAAMAVARRAPTVILRPASGAMKAVGMALHGVGNEIDREGRRRVSDKYKRH